MRYYKNYLKDRLLFIKNKSTTSVLAFSFIKWVLLGAIVGVFTGSAGAAFLKSLELATNLRVENSWLLFLLPIGGTFVSFIYSKYGRNSSKGNNLILENINNSGGTVPMRMAPLVFLGTVITHLFGGSAGREGTGVQIGSTIAEGVGRIFKLDKYDSRIILMCGISSGFASVFGTPLAGTIFGLEVATLGIMSYEALIPCFSAAIVGDLVSAAWGIHHTHYKILQVPEITILSVLKVVIAAIIFGLVSKLFSELTHKLKEVFTKVFPNAILKSFVGGILIITLVYIVGSRDYLGLSIPLISDSFNDKVQPLTFLGKLIFTSLTLGTGFQGGEVTPLFVIGSTLGNALSSILHMSPSFLAALGLIGVFTGATNTPIASLLLSIEMFGAQGVEFMFMSCIISYVFSGHTGIYVSQRIGRSKSKVITVEENTSLLSFKNKHKRDA
jgi:H+/Cl- antiporter ClcA